MTMEEVWARYRIPLEILREYENWGLCGTAKGFDDSDLERLSLIMTLHDIGFNSGEVENYMRLLMEGCSTDLERLSMLDRKRRTALDEIHFWERQLERLDDLRYRIRNEMGK